MFTAIRENNALGATIVGLDINRPLRDEQLSALESALAEHQVLFFRDQEISHSSHQALGLQFGALMRHPSYPTVQGYPDIFVLENDRENPPRIEEWHIDMSFSPRPPLGSILVGRVMPQSGGDTLFSSLAAAYDDIPDSMQRDLEGLSATHSMAHGFRESLAEPGGPERLNDALRKNPDTSHALVQTHPVSGRKLIYYSQTFTKQINGLSTKDSDDLMAWLHRHTAQEKYIYRFNWGRHSIAFWDNRSVIHKPVNDYWPARRRMERVTISNPVAPA